MAVRARDRGRVLRLMIALCPHWEGDLIIGKGNLTAI
ncbi:MAG: hypothetical protein QOF69_89, partial [Solirubrobacteraceae bacterium]|nr:hypothetical protein [Solirubrobacteraceae bacterium]